MRKGFSSHKKAASGEGGEQGFWPSYADMMSSFALILFFLMLLSYIQNLVTGNTLQSTQETLLSTETQLALTQTEVEDAEKHLDQIQISLDEAKEQLKGQQEQLSTQQALIKDQEDYLAAANEELLEMRSQMQTIAVLRLSILQQIKDSIAEVMDDPSKVEIGDNGNIILNEGIFFDLGSYAIKSESKPVLNQLTDVFSKFLSKEENSKYIDSIVISGHTDDIGSDEDNRILSTNRANAVLNYLLSGELNRFSQYFCAAGYGETRPVESNTTDAGRAANRRIEISIILKDDSVLDIVNEYLEIDVPSSASSYGKSSSSDRSGSSSVTSGSYSSGKNNNYGR